MKKTVRLLVVLIGSISTSPAIAEPGKWYIGAGAGPSFYNDWSADVTAFEDALGVVNFDGTRSTDSDDNAFGYKLFGGYSFHENIAVEFSYIDMGKVDATSSASGTFYDAMDNTIVGGLNASANANVDAFTLDVALNYPVTPVISLIAKGGVYAANTKLELSASSDIPGTDNYDFSKTERSNGLHYAVGVNFKVTDTIGLRAEWERLDNIEARNGESDVDLLSAGLIYNF